MPAFTAVKAGCKGGLKMKRIILAPDSFKGTLSAREVCRVEARAIRRLCPGAEVVELIVMVLWWVRRSGGVEELIGSRI